MSEVTCPNIVDVECPKQKIQFSVRHLEHHTFPQQGLALVDAHGQGLGDWEVVVLRIPALFVIMLMLVLVSVMVLVLALVSKCFAPDVTDVTEGVHETVHQKQIMVILHLESFLAMNI